MCRVKRLLFGILTLTVCLGTAQLSVADVSKLQGTWTRKTNKGQMRLKINGNRLRITLKGGTVGQVLDNDFNTTKDNILYGIVTNIRTQGPQKLSDSDIQEQEAGFKELVDQPFRFRYRIDQKHITIKDSTLPGLSGTYRKVGRAKAKVSAPKNPPSESHGAKHMFYVPVTTYRFVNGQVVPVTSYQLRSSPNSIPSAIGIAPTPSVPLTPPAIMSTPSPCRTPYVTPTPGPVPAPSSGQPTMTSTAPTCLRVPLTSQVASRPRFNVEYIQFQFLEPENAQVRIVETSSEGTIPCRMTFKPGIYRVKLHAFPGKKAIEVKTLLEIPPANPETEEYLAHNSVSIKFTTEDIARLRGDQPYAMVWYLTGDQATQGVSVVRFGGPGTSSDVVREFQENTQRRILCVIRNQ
ncbi:MAG: hypothetical protein ACFCD0_26185 [Gemmataceae bacterium]